MPAPVNGSISEPGPVTYFGELKRAMEWLAAQRDTLFLGQAVGSPGTAMFNTLKDIDPGKRLELPVAEEMQMGMSIGLALEGHVPVSIFPRWNFLLLAINQLVNHLDKLPLISEFAPRVIIRTGIGSVHPLDPQWQHKGDFTEMIQGMLHTVHVVRLEKPEEIVPAYQAAYRSRTPTILCEVSDFLDEEFRLMYEKFTCSYRGVNGDGPAVNGSMNGKNGFSAAHPRVH
jgi:pyruvate/2-oxoglutarate/acetoin dehydrogenase E1 component